MKNRSILVTGATGIMGSWVLGEALKRGYTPYALMRDSSEDAARERLRAVLALPEAEDHLEDVQIVLGDTTRPNFGLSEAALADLLGRIGGVIHCAASTSFSPRKDAVLWQTNVDAVVALIDLLRGTGVPLYHVSTAYVAGKRSGRVLETELTPEVPYKNTYERTKREAERLVNEAIAKGDITGAIFRPSIIVGASQEGRISQFLNFYTIIRYVDLLQRNKLGEPSLRLQGNPHSTLNLVPVDWVAEALWRIIEAEGASGDTYHLTHCDPPTQQSISAWASAVLRDADGTMSFQTRLDGTIGNAERQANEAMTLYRDYLVEEPVFDRGNTDRALGNAFPTPKINASFLDGLLAYAQEHRWQGVFGCKLSGVQQEEAPPQQIALEILRRDITDARTRRDAV
ncbi:MAG: SDR family oxidoreductase [Candidatus Hydrogenedentes bacterium]|nr:SDR family oxidoreductase [Candidatus Hydrogenedentota bacterium]